MAENKVQEAIEKWTDVKLKCSNKAHLIGKLQSTVKIALQLFDLSILWIVKISKKNLMNSLKTNKKIKLFIRLTLEKKIKNLG